MAARRCPACDTSVGEGDRICFVCFRRLESVVVHEPVVARAEAVVRAPDRLEPALGDGPASLAIEVRWGRLRHDVTVPPTGSTFGSTSAADFLIAATFLAPVHAKVQCSQEGWTIEPCSPGGLVLQRGAPVGKAVIEVGDVLRLADKVGNFATLKVGLTRTRRAAAGHLRCRLPNAEETLVIGAAAECDVQLHHPLVRPRHARLRRDRGGVLWLEDRVTVAGTYVNGLRLRGRKELARDDTVQIGPFSARVGTTALEPLAQVSGVGVTTLDAGVRVSSRSTGPKTLLDGVNLHLQPGSLTAIAGPSGAGKTTLMRLLSGQIAPSSGTVLYNDTDLSRCRQAYAGLMGFVPQDDVVHADLSAAEALDYQGRLRLGRDATDADRRRAVDRVLGFVGMAEQRDQLVHTLSGGQRKRVSIATELLDEPEILFLDEPTSGLDPGLDKRMMLLLRMLADQGRTVILTTHAIAHVDVCDTLVIVGPGGRVIYSGEPEETARWFDVESLSDAFSLVDTPDAASAAASRLQAATARSPIASPGQGLRTVAPGVIPSERDIGRVPRPRSPVAGRPPFGSPAWREIVFYQGRIFASRQARLLTRDRAALGFCLSQGIAVAALTALVAPHPLVWDEKGNGPMFIFGCAAVWFGMINAVRELVKERTIWRREQLAGASAEAYLLSKLVVLGALAAVQSLTTVVILDVLLGVPPGSPLGSPMLTIAGTLWLATIAGTSMALVISALAPSSDRAMSLVPYLLITQLVLCGVLLPLGGLNFLSWLVPARWAVSALGGIAGLSAAALHQTSGLYPHSIGGLLLDWVFLILLSVAGIVATAKILDHQAAIWSVG